MCGRCRSALLLSRLMPEINRTPWPDRLRVAAWAALVVIVVWPRLVGFTTDSDAFIDVARTLLEGKGLAQSVVDFWRPGIPDPLGMWPPVYPLAIAALGALGVALPLAARLLSGIAFVLFALAFHGYARRAGGRPFAFVTTLVVLLGPGLAQAGATAWSEPPYLFLLTLALIGAWDLVHAEAPSVARAAFSGLLLGLAADTRYLGLAVVPLMFVLVARRVRGRALLAWAAGALVPIGIWLTHNVAAFGRPFGPELPPGVRTLPGVLRVIGGSMRWEFLPPAVALSPLLAYLSLLLLAAAVAWALRAGGLARWSALVALVQLGSVALATWGLAINEPQGRYTLVAWPFLGLVACAAARRAIVRAFGDSRAATIATIGAAGIALLLVGAGLGTFLGTNVAPPGQLVARRHAQNAMMRLVPQGDGPILTDSGHLLRLATGRSSVQVPPPRWRMRQFDEADEARWRGRGVTHALFRDDSRGRLGPWLNARVTGGWTAVDSAAGLVLYVLEPPAETR